MTPVEDHGGRAAFVLTMLASSGPVAAPASAWAFEPKLDGWRVLVSIDGGLTVRTRNGHNVTASVPELEPIAAALEGHAVVLEGELVAAKAGRSTSTAWPRACRPTRPRQWRVDGRGCR